VAATVVRDHLVRARCLAPLGTALLTGLVVHAGVAPHLAVGGVAPDVLLVAVVAVAAKRGARAGAAFGFAAGLGADLFVPTPLGTSALAFTLVGHVLGRRGRPPSSSGTAAARRAALRRSVVVGFLGVGAGRLGVAMVATALAGVPFPDAQGLLRVAAVAAASAPFGPVAFAAVGRLSRPPRGR
jgi:rod shape-determining protein MreD